MRFDKISNTTSQPGLSPRSRPYLVNNNIRPLTNKLEINDGGGTSTDIIIEFAMINIQR